MVKVTKEEKNKESEQVNEKVVEEKSKKEKQEIFDKGRRCRGGQREWQ